MLRFPCRDQIPLTVRYSVLYSEYWAETTLLRLGMALKAVLSQCCGTFNSLCQPQRRKLWFSFWEELYEATQKIWGKKIKNSGINIVDYCSMFSKVLYKIRHIVSLFYIKLSMTLKNIYILISDCSSFWICSNRLP